MDQTEKSLLMFLETCAVDHGGVIVSARMNKEEFVIAERWNKEGLIEFGRVCFEDIKQSRFPATHWVRLTSATHDLVHSFRRERMERMWKNRRYRTTEEKRKE